MRIAGILQFALLGIAFFAATTARSQDLTRAKKITVLPVPAIGYSPETKTYVGAVTLFTFNILSDTLTRTSNAKIELNYSWNKQLIAESGWNYFSPGEIWFTRGIIHYSKYPDLYYGIGFNTPESNEVSFQSNRFIFDVDILRNIRNKLFFGLGINTKSYTNIDYLQDEATYSELKNENSYSLKILLLNDSRNNILSPSKGNYFELNNAINTSSTFYFKTEVDYRRYTGFGKLNHVLAGRIYHKSIFGNPPFYDFAMMGGDKYVRGYYLGRFRDKNLTTLQLEHRMKLFRWLGFATFGGISVVYNRFSAIEYKSFKPNAGVGLRFLVDKNENTNLRFDYAVGAQNQSGFYISFGESF